MHAKVVISTIGSWSATWHQFLTPVIWRRWVWRNNRRSLAIIRCISSPFSWRNFNGIVKTWETNPMLSLPAFIYLCGRTLEKGNSFRVLIERSDCILVLPRFERNTHISLLSTRVIAVYFQLPLQWSMTVFIKHHIVKKTITVVCVQFQLHWRMIIRCSSILNMGVSLGPGKHKKWLEVRVRGHKGFQKCCEGQVKRLEG